MKIARIMIALAGALVGVWGFGTIGAHLHHPMVGELVGAALGSAATGATFNAFRKVWMAKAVKTAHRRSRAEP